MDKALAAQLAAGEYGPYASDAHARVAWEASSRAVPQNERDVQELSALALARALDGARLTPLTSFEQEQAHAVARLLGPEAAQVIAGWITRAYAEGPKLGEQA